MTNKLRTTAIISLIAVAINALVAGYLFMTDPSGQQLGISIALLRFSSFKDFFLPGLLLFTLNGLVGLITATALIRRWSFYPIRVCFQGFLLTGWIVIQALMIRQFNLLHAIFGATGIFLIVTGITLLTHPDD